MGTDLAHSPRGLAPEYLFHLATVVNILFTVTTCSFFIAILLHNSYYVVLIDNIKNCFSFHFLFMSSRQIDVFS